MMIQHTLNFDGFLRLNHARVWPHTISEQALETYPNMILNRRTDCLGAVVLTCFLGGHVSKRRLKCSRDAYFESDGSAIAICKFEDLRHLAVERAC